MSRRILVFSEVLTLLRYVLYKPGVFKISFIILKFLWSINCLKENQRILGFFHIVHCSEEMIYSSLIDLFVIVKVYQLFKCLIMEFCTVEPGVMSTQWKQEKKAQYQNNDSSCGFIGQNFRDLRFHRNVTHSLLIFRITIFIVVFIYIDRAGLIFVLCLSHRVNFLGSMCFFYFDCLIDDFIIFFVFLKFSSFRLSGFLLGNLCLFIKFDNTD